MKIKSVTLLLLALTFSTLAQAQQMKKDVAASGGGHSESLAHRLDCTTGQVCIGRASSASSQLQAGFWTGFAAAPPACDYLLADINGDNQVRAGDVTYGVRYFKGTGSVPPDSCYDEAVPALTHWLYVAGDVNADCQFKGSDITRLVQFFKGLTVLSNCPLFPMPVTTISSAEPQPIPVSILNEIREQQIQSPLPSQIKGGTKGENERNLPISAPLTEKVKDLEKTSPIRKK